MAKCPICNSRKGKRKCLAQEGFICSLCCGEMRSSENCNGCSYFKGTSSTRNYRKVPYYTLSQMSDDPLLQDQTNVIESALCQFDDETDGDINDKTAAKILALLLDRYHFKDENPVSTSEQEEDGSMLVDRAIKEDLSSLQPDKLSKLLATVYRSMDRHSGYERDYIDFIHAFVGSSGGKKKSIFKKFFLPRGAHGQRPAKHG